MRKMSILDKDSCEGMLDIYSTETNDDSVKIYFHEPHIPYLFEWVKGTKGVNTYYKDNYVYGVTTGSVIDPEGYFSWSYPQGKATIATAKKQINGKLKEWGY